MNAIDETITNTPKGHLKIANKKRTAAWKKSKILNCEVDVLCVVKEMRSMAMMKWKTTYVGQTNLKGLSNSSMNSKS